MWPRFASVLELDVSGLERAGGDNTSLGATEVELLRRLNLALDVDWPHYASVVKDQLATEVLARRPGPRRITIGVDDHPWVRKQAQQFVDEIREAGYHVVGDLADLLPLEEDLETGFPEPSDGELLDAAVDALARLVPRVPQEWPRNRSTPSRFFCISESGTHPRWRFAGSRSGKGVPPSGLEFHAEGPSRRPCRHGLLVGLKEGAQAGQGPGVDDVVGGEPAGLRGGDAEAQDVEVRGGVGVAGDRTSRRTAWPTGCARAGRAGPGRR